MDIDLARVIGAVVVLALVINAGFLAATNRPGYGWFLFVALLIAGGVLK